MNLRVIVCLSLWMATAGCGLLTVPATSLQRLPTNEAQALVIEFRGIRSLDDVKNRLNELVAAPNAQEQAEVLLSGWGRHGSWFDLSVVMFLQDYWPGAYSQHADKLDAHRLFDIACERLGSKPELCHQVAWHMQWRRCRSSLPWLVRSEPFCGMGPCVQAEGDKFPQWLLWCGLIEHDGTFAWPGFPSPHSLSWDSMNDEFYRLQAMIAAFHPYMRYDHQRGIYVCDKEAYDAHRYLSLEEQVPSRRETPLPDWKSDVNPPPPKSLGEE